MKSRRLVFFAIFASILMVTAPAGQASAHTGDRLVVGSQHTTDSDFSNAKTLDNLTISGSGENASVKLPTRTIVDDHEDGDVDEYQGSTSGLSAQTNVVAHGSYAAKYDGDGSFHEFYATESTGINSNVSQGGDFSTHVRFSQDEDRIITGFASQGEKQNWYRIDFDDGNNVVRFQKDTRAQGGSVSELDSFSTELDNGTFYRADVSWGTDGSFSIDIVDTSSETTIGTLSATDTTFTEGGIGGIAGDTNGNYYWDYTFIRSDISSGTYISQNHSVSNAEEAALNVTLSNATATVTVTPASSDTVLNETTISGTGNHSLSLDSTSEDKLEVNVTFDKDGDNPTAKLHDESILFTNHAPSADNATASPSGDKKLSSRSVTLEIDISDQEFGTAQGEEVTGDFLVKGPSDSSFSSVGADSRTSNGTISTDYTANEGGTYEWKVEINDSYGGEVTSDTFSFQAPANLSIREESSPHDLITSQADVTVKFYEDTQDDPTIIERSDDDNDGKIDLSGLPTGTQFTVVANADGYHNRTIILDSLYSQQSVFLLNKSEPSVESTFIIEDRTGNYPTEDTEIVIQKAVNRSKYDSTNTDTYNWTNIAGDDLGADEAYVTDLRHEERYRIRVQNNGGDSRILGSYTAENDGTIRLNIGNVVIDPEGPDTVGYDAEWTNETGQPVQVTFEYNDSTENTTKLYLHIYERNNESNELLANTSFDGPYGTFSTVEDVPASENGTTWVVEFTAVRDGASNISGTLIVGPQRDVLQNLSPWVVTLFFVGMIWTTAGLFSQINGDVGGLVVAGEGAMMWYVGLVPTGLGSGVVALALFTAAVLFVRERRGGGL